MVTNKQERKERPMARGLLDYFPDALAAVSNVSFIGNRQHNPGEELHWSRGKSDDHADTIVRHLIERGKLDTDGLRHTAKVAWRALALLQIEIEKDAEADKHADAFEEYYSKPIPTKPHPTSLKECTSNDPHGLNDPLVGRDCNVRNGIWFNQLKRLGCPEGVAKLIAMGTKFPSADASDAYKAILYIAGPMRGLPEFNFPAFDAARDMLVQEGYAVISPADIDRAAKDQNSGDQARFAFRDFWSLYAIAKCGAKAGVALLPRWEKSTGAAGEFFLARWLGLAFIKLVYGRNALDSLSIATSTYTDMLVQDFALAHCKAVN